MQSLDRILSWIISFLERPILTLVPKIKLNITTSERNWYTYLSMSSLYTLWSVILKFYNNYDKCRLFRVKSLKRGPNWLAGNISRKNREQGKANKPKTEGNDRYVNNRNKNVGKYRKDEDRTNSVNQSEHDHIFSSSDSSGSRGSSQE